MSGDFFVLFISDERETYSLTLKVGIPGTALRSIEDASIGNGADETSAAN